MDRKMGRCSLGPSMTNTALCLKRGVPASKARTRRETGQPEAEPTVDGALAPSPRLDQAMNVAVSSRRTVLR